VQSATLINNVCGSYSFLATLTGTPATETRSTGCYLYTLTGTDNVGNTLSLSTTVKVDTTAPSAPTLTPSVTGSAYQNGSGPVFYKSTGTGSFTLVANSTDADTGIASYQFPTLGTGWTSSGSGNTRTYSFASGATSPGIQSVTATNGIGTAGAASNFTVTADSTAPGSGAFTVNSVPASAGGSTSSSSATNFTITGRTDYTDAGSGLASSVLTVQSATYNGTTCGAAGSGGPFTSATTISGTTQPNGILSGFCYIYTLTGTDNVGNTSTVSSTVIATISYTFTVSSPGARTAGTAFGGVVLHLQANGSDTTGYYGTAYSGNKAIAFSGPANSPSGATPSYPSTVSFTSGAATLAANSITLVKAETVALTATDSSPSIAIAGTSSTFTVSAGTASRLAWTSVSVSTGTNSTPCYFDCTTTAIGNFGTFTASVSVTDGSGNVLSNLGTSRTITVANGTGTGGFTAPTSGSSVTLTVPASGTATSTANFTFKAQNGNWTSNTFTASATGTPALTSANGTVTKP
jgi:hypothetical protein